MTRRPWTVSGAAVPGRVGVPTVLLADADADACAQVRDALLEGTGPCDLRTAAAYEAGANTVIAKPVTFLARMKLMKVFTAYWLEAALLPE